LAAGAGLALRGADDTRDVSDDLDLLLDRTFAAVPNWKLVTPEERSKLKGLIEHYRGMPHPFTQCVTDNSKRFGKERAERVCAVLKDLIRRTTKWRGEKKMSEVEPMEGVTVEDIRALAQQDVPGHVWVSESKRARGHWRQMAVLPYKKRKAMPPSAFVFPSEKRYPIHDRAHAANALARSSGKPEEATVRAAVCKRYPDLPACQERKHVELGDVFRQLAWREGEHPRNTRGRFPA
jgi:hypothetical protein